MGCCRLYNSGIKVGRCAERIYKEGVILIDLDLQIIEIEPDACWVYFSQKCFYCMQPKKEWGGCSCIIVVLKLVIVQKRCGV